jgi:hypothetical protein
VANRFRNEVEVELFGRTYILDPGFKSICEIEDAANGETSVSLMFLQMAKKVLTLKTTSLVLFGCLKAKGVETSLDEVMKEVHAKGFPNFAPPVTKLLLGMCSKEIAEEVELKKESPELKDESPVSIGSPSS